MSNKVDKFITALEKAQGDELLFATTRPVRIRIGDEEKVVLDQEVRTDQIDNLVKPCIDPDEQAKYMGNGENNFSYESPIGRVKINVKRKNAMLMVTISRDTGSGAAAPASQAVNVIGDAMVLEGFDSGRHSDPEPVQRVSAPPRAAPPKQVTDIRQSQAQMQSQQPQMQEAPPMQMQQPQGGHGGGGHGGGGHGGGHGGGGGVAVLGGGPRIMASERAKPAPGTATIDKILTILAKAGASDLHMTAGQRPKMRKDGDIVELPGTYDVFSGDYIQELMFEVAAPRVRQQYLDSSDADYSHEVPGVARFRMNMFRDRIGTGAVIRTIPSKILTADDLNLPPITRMFCGLPKGLVCVTGPTGSGKSTTLAAMVDLINKSRSDHIITIEDPVEFVHQSQKCLVNQREVHTHTESFSRALKAALREDPDIVLVGEMRDLETVHIAIETAETGHLVFGTLHTNTAASTVDRIIDQFPTDRQSQIRVMLSESLKGVIAQTLCKKIGGGRCAVLEILIVNNAISNLIREGKTFQIMSIMQTGKKEGQQTQVDAMLDLIKQGKITPLEAYTKAADQGLMKGALERNGHTIQAK